MSTYVQSRSVSQNARRDLVDLLHKARQLLLGVALDPTCQRWGTLALDHNNEVQGPEIPPELED